MRLPSLTLLAPACHCQACHDYVVSAPVGSLDDEWVRQDPGSVWGHYSRSQHQWLCAYCAGPVTRRRGYSPWYKIAYHSARDWLGWLRWEWQVRNI